ncbi:MAG: DEAD/DEAH box helicase, partial [Acidimicrobiales bacterium]
MSFTVGALVAARGRDWVVQPGSTDDCVLVRPLGGTDDEVTGILPALEPIGSTVFDPPDPTVPGDHRSAALLRDALRIGFRSSAGPFRSLGAIAVEPRPYQLVPLLMALRLDPVRLLIADAVGIGKTIEAALVARELLDTGIAHRLAVLCPPHLAEQWRDELAAKFHLDATLVLASTAARLERDLPPGRTIFDVHPVVIVSTDFIKAERRRAEFVRTCPDLVIVDEAHTCTLDASGSTRARQQRFELLAALAADPARHLLLVTATPHSGKPGAFRSLLSLLDVDFEQLPDDLSGDHNRRHRERLARHLVQRQRGDLAEFLGGTEFPQRYDAEETYRLSPAYRDLLTRVLRYCRELVADPGDGQHR